ncbi:MAG TPA: PAS domain-containing sensor histidine kinase [Candidatus Dormibacteraeota bacterium]
MPVPSRIPDPLRIASALSPVLFGLGDPDLLVELLNANPAGIVLVEATHNLPIVYCNDAFRRWVSVTRRPPEGRSLPDLFAWSDRAAIRAAYREVTHTGLPVHWRSAAYHELDVDGPTHRLAYWNISHFPVRGPAGQVTHVLSFAVDVTAQARAGTRIQEAQHRLLGVLGGIVHHLNGEADVQAFFEGLTATIADLVSARQVAFWLHDPATETMSPQAGAFGFTADDLVSLGGAQCRRGGGRVIDRVVFEDLVVWEAGRITIPWRAAERRLGAVGVYGSTRRSGFTEEDLWVLRAAAAAAALVWEHRLADEALADLRDREATGLRQQIQQAMQLEQLKTDFLKLASHELRAPLGVVRGYISMIEDGTLGPVDTNVSSVLPLLRGKLDDMNRLINDMLETARLEDSALQLRLAPLDLRDIVHQSVRSLEPLADPRHGLITSTPGRSVMVMGDPSRLSMVLTNLVHNALKYSPDGGEVRITCTVTDGRAQVAVADQGVGIAPESLGLLFTRFGRVITQQTSGIGGTGLGLYLARDLARRHGGDVEVESEPGRGSTFTLTLPVAPEP